MSGDVQPRKRKDKKRKKEESTEQIPIQPQVLSPSIQTEDINIHVHKEDGTGGGICAKIVFFFLFSALAVLIGLIITEHRGLTDLDTTEQESRFSHLFEGWIDNSLSHDEHENEHVTDSLEDEDHGEGEEAESHEAHEEEEAEEEQEEGSEEVAETEEEEEEEAEASEEVPQTEEEEEEEEEDEGTTEDEEPNVSVIEDEDEDEDASEVKEDDEDEDAEVSEEDNDVSRDVEQSAEEEDEGDDTVVSKEKGEDDDDEGEEEEAASEEGVTEKSEEKVSEEVKEEEELSKEEKDEAPGEKEEEAPEEGHQNSKMVVKIGVGVALVIVAHVVLVRKWKSAPPEIPKKEEPLPDLSRRNTIVVPPDYQEVEQDIQEVEEEYSDEDGEVESDEEKHEPKSAKSRYQELRTTYTRSLTPESEPEYQSKPTDVDDEEYEDEEDEEEVDDEEEEEDSETGEYEKDDDEDDLLKRLEARYGKLGGNEEAGKEDEDEQFTSWKRVNVRGDNEAEESESDRQSDAETYEYESITNKDDFKIKEKIDEAHQNIQNNTAYAIKLFDVLLQNYSSSPRSLYGKAQALDILADKKRSNDILQRAVSIYLKILALGNVPDALFETVAERCINRMRFMGNYNGAIDIHQKLITRFPQVNKFKNQLVVSYLTINRVNKARVTLRDVLSKDPDDGFALVHYGFILKTVDNKLNESVFYLQKGINTKAPGVIDGRFYFHLGDALARLGKTDEAMKIYDDAVRHKLFFSKYQRSLYNVARLKGQPWWKKGETPYSNLYTALESNWKKIREEGISVLNKNGQFQSESENLKDTGDWKQFELFARGEKNVNNCKKCPVTCKIIESIPDARGCRRGQTKFSVMHPGTHVWPHCGPTNCRLRVHLGLRVPPHTYIRVANEIRSWKDGEVLVFDDSFEHEVWHNGTSLRLVLIVDVWHPELTSSEKRTLSPI